MNALTPGEPVHEEVDRLVELYDGGVINRRQLVHRLLTIGLGMGAAGRELVGQTPAPVVRARAINHVTLYASDVARSKAFYQRLAGLPIRDEGKDFCEFRLDNGFLGIYATEPGQRAGFDHFCLGMKSYDAKRTHASIAAAFPDNHATIENKDQVYVQDPDGVRVQFADVGYKR
jgi:catechol 2,3-dioxygenase-like lactoylglutathione lyase family enzyme